MTHDGGIQFRCFGILVFNIFPLVGIIFSFVFKRCFNSHCTPVSSRCYDSAIISWFVCFVTARAINLTRVNGMT